MTRNHIHLAQGVAGDNVVSGTLFYSLGHSLPSLTCHRPGMRKSSQVLIYVDLRKALAAGIKFHLSDNGVILTEGDERGFLDPKFFSKVENANGSPISRPGNEDTAERRPGPEVKVVGDSETPPVEIEDKSLKS